PRHPARLALRIRHEHAVVADVRAAVVPAHRAVGHRDSDDVLHLGETPAGTGAVAIALGVHAPLPWARRYERVDLVIAPVERAVIRRLAAAAPLFPGHPAPEVELHAPRQALVLVRDIEADGAAGCAREHDVIGAVAGLL